MRRLFVLLVLPSLAPRSPRGAGRDHRAGRGQGERPDHHALASSSRARSRPPRRRGSTPRTSGTFLRQNNAQILQEAIDEILILQKAEDAGIKAPAEWIDEAIDGIKKENNITSDEQFQDALDARGPDPRRAAAEHRARDRAAASIMQRDIQPKIEATESELRAEYEKLKATEFTKPAHGHPAGDPRQGGRGRDGARAASSRRRRGPARTSRPSPRPTRRPPPAPTAATSASSRRAR